MTERNIIFKDFMDRDFEQWLQAEGLSCKEIDQHLIIIYCDEYCIKLYDRAGHGYSFTANLAQAYSEGYYQDGEISFFWVFSYFELKTNSSFETRRQDDYLRNLPLFIQDLKTVVGKLDGIDASFWESLSSFALEEWERHSKRTEADA